MNGNFTDRKDALRALRWDRVKKNRVLWGLFVLSFVLSFLCPLLINIEYCAIFYPTLNAVLNGLANISFGYFSGFLVYLFGSFLPGTKRDIEIIDSIYFSLYNISVLLDMTDKHFLHENEKRLKGPEFEAKLYNFIVKDANVSDILEANAKRGPLYANTNNLKFLSRRLSLLNNNIEQLITAYGREMKSDEIARLSSMSKLESALLESIDDNGVTLDEDRVYLFVSDYYQYTHLVFDYIISCYNRYKYCEYNCSRVNK